MDYTNRSSCIESRSLMVEARGQAVDDGGLGPPKPNCRGRISVDYHAGKERLDLTWNLLENANVVGSEISGTCNFAFVLSVYVTNQREIRGS
ncbi:uncharacterized protein N7473_003119 [Penicillium subrubescens]|uniref:uncharacterized protein n=1 Tax=Penicillium subrubescens TaxID=1316194 RepID=UPI0025453F38|nr:uncharacterized protein N7473_003119 [Penicillium subrubescens]KAJ5906203.1 hypothetical protein N7473_003119 [Penicillium subrubescens]